MPVDIVDASYGNLLKDHPLSREFFDQVSLGEPSLDSSVRTYFDGLDEFQLADCGMDAASLAEAFSSYVQRMEALSRHESQRIDSLTITGGVDKEGRPEDFSLTARAGDIICVVGPTGSGKSRLLEDIEYLAQGDTPTKRSIAVNGGSPDARMRYAVEDRVVAQLSQSMVFVMDLSVREFLRLHAESRMMQSSSVDRIVDQTIACANDLAGEPFSPKISLTMLSGGQSRALMIADLAFISTSPIVLVDEIENAGVDRKRALELLISNDKIVFVVTHDPLIALMGTKRLVVGNGAVKSIIEPDECERKNADALYRIDEVLMSLRRKIRLGGRIEDPIEVIPNQVEEGGR
jgi:ABC-type lipoprotein export system ATPase subunit